MGMGDGGGLSPAYSRGGLIKILTLRVGAYSRGGLFEGGLIRGGGGLFEDPRPNLLANHKRYSSDIQTQKYQQSIFSYRIFLLLHQYIIFPKIIPTERTNTTKKYLTNGVNQTRMVIYEMRYTRRLNVRISYFFKGRVDKITL